MAWAGLATELLWRHAWAVIPLALLVALVCRCVRCRPATRHMLWVVVLLWFVAPLILPAAPVERWAASSTPAAGGTTDAQRQAAAGIAGRPLDGPVASSTHPPATPLTVELLDPVRRIDLVAPLAAGVNPAADVAPALARARRPARTPPAGTAAASDAAEAPTTTDLAISPRTDARPESGTPLWLPQASGSGGPWSRSGTERARTDAIAGRGLRILDAAPARPGPTSSTSEPLFAAGIRNPQSTAERDGRDARSTPIAEDVGTTQAYPRMQDYLAGWIAVRDALGRVPALPAGIWIAGAAGLLLWHAASLVWFRHTLRRARPAPGVVLHQVAGIARKLGVSRIPQTLMLDARISPLMLCGRRARLILPTRLWSELDAAGRRAILCHELAHLRRRDHWVAWAGLLIAAAYWWHPVMWWARRRIHEEADLSCDAWVTWLLPQGRRAYAEALLKAGRFVGAENRTVPPTGMGVTSAGARKLARRLTMVMTQSARPRRSLLGLALACGVGLAGWAATPALSCPPKEKDRQKQCAPTLSAPTAPAAPAATLAAPSPGAPPVAPTAPAFWAASPMPSDAAAPMFTTAPADEAWRPYAPDALVKYLLGTPGGVSGYVTYATSTPGWIAPGLFAVAGDPPDEDELRERLERLEAELKALARDLKARSEQDKDKAKAKRRAGQPAAPARPRPPAAPQPPRPPAARGGVLGGGVIVKVYELPQGKLEALTALMIREDVPVRVRRVENGIEVHGTARQHEVFEAFVDLIHPEGGVEPHGEGHAGGGARGEGAEAQGLAAVLQAKAAERQAEVMARARAQTQARREAARVQRAIARKELERQAQELQKQVDDLEAAERLDAQANEVREAAEMRDKDSPARRDLERQVRELERQSRTLEQKAREIQRKAQELESRSERLEREAERGEAETAKELVPDLVQALGAIPVLEAEARPQIAEALRNAAEALRDEAGPGAAEALDHVGEVIRDHASPAVADALQRLLGQLDEQAPTQVVKLLDGVAEELESDAAATVLEVLSRVAELLEQRAREAEQRDAAEDEAER